MNNNKYVYIHAETNIVLVEWTLQECENARIWHGYNNFEVQPADPNYNIAKIIYQERLNNSANGNPKFEFVFIDKHGTHKWITATDSSFCYWINNINSNCAIIKYHYTKKGKCIIDDLQKRLELNNINL